MNIFITGATGYIGNNLAFRLANEGHIVHAICRSASKKDLLRHPNIRLFKGDIMDIVSLEEGMKGCTQVYHLAAYARVWAKDKSVFYNLNVKGTQNVLDVAKKLGVEKIVFTSTAGVLGPSGNRPIKENDAKLTDDFNEYETTKMQAEELCKKYALENGQHIVIVNPPRIYGPGIESESNAVTKLIKLYLSGKWRFLPGDGNGTGSYVYIDDIVEGHILAMEKGRSGECYILSGANLTYKQFFTELSSASGKKVSLWPLPLWLMLAAGRMIQLKSFLTRTPPLLTIKWIKKYTYNWSLDCTKAQKELGYTYIPLNEGLKKTLNWINKK